jgi:hypothetical protein
MQFVMTGLVLVTLLLIGATSISAQIQTKNVTNVMGFTTQNINGTLDHQRLLIDRAELHQANNTGNDLLQCIQTLLLHGTDKSYKIDFGNCDGLIINHLTIKNDPNFPDYGDNKTMINLAHAYLKARNTVTNNDQTK